MSRELHSVLCEAYVKLVSACAQYMPGYRCLSILICGLNVSARYTMIETKCTKVDKNVLSACGQALTNLFFK